MRALYIYRHPLPESFHAAIRVRALDALAAAGHWVDLLDLYAEKFDPVLSEEARRHYHDPLRYRFNRPQAAKRPHAARPLRLRAAGR